MNEVKITKKQLDKEYKKARLIYKKKTNIDLPVKFLDILK